MSQDQKYSILIVNFDREF